MFDFTDVYDNDVVDAAALATELLQSLDGDVGHISHLLIGPTSNRAEWAVVIDDDELHYRVVPVHLLDWVDDALLVPLPQDSVDALLSISDPEQLPAHRLTKAVMDAAGNLTQYYAERPDVGDDASGEVLDGIDRSLVAGSGLYELRSINEVAATITGGVTPPAVQSPSGEVGLGSEPQYFPGEPDTGAGDDGWMAPLPPPPPAPSSPSPTGSGQAVGEAVRGEPEALTGRSMIAELPKSVHVGRRFSVQVQINEEAGTERYTKWLPGVVGGSTVTVNATVPESFDIHGDLVQDITVPESGNSDPALFSFTPKGVGTFTVRLTAFVGGSYIGDLQTEVSVAHTRAGTTREETDSLSGRPAQAGEVSLQITFDDATRTFRFLFVAGGDWRPVPSKPIQGDLQVRLESVIKELDSYARAQSGLSETDVQQRIRIRGFELWRDLVPDEIKTAIFDHLDDISQLTIISDREIVPWELLYPQSAAGDEPGFLVSLFPVNRWIMATPWTDRLSLDRPLFVVPENSPPLASDEARSIGRSLGSPDAATVKSRQQLLARLSDPRFDLLHFACHNSFSTDAGSNIKFPDSPFTPSDLALHAASKPLRDRNSLVFINACRTQGTTPTYTAFENWAKSFLDLGAVAVIGTSWAVRDRAARPFAEAVYERLDAGDTLGQSVATARTRVSTTLGDPTWLAYTVYGDPNAKVVSSP